MMAAVQRSQASFDFCHEPHSGALLQGLEGLRSNSLLVDVVLCVAGKEIPCHRNVLAACSGYFHAMFCNGLRESKEHRVTIQEVSTSTLQLLVDYAYTSKVTITEHNAVKLLEGANFFQIQPVFDACTTFLSEHLCAQNCLSMLDLGGMLCPDLEQKALPYAMKEFAAVSKTPEFLYLRKDQLVTLLSSDDLNASEETVYTAVMAWINHDTRKRRKEMKELMELVRFPFMDNMYFIEKVETNNAIRKSCPDIVMETRRYQLYPEEVQSPRTRPRRVSGLREAVVVIGGTENLKGESTPSVYSNSIMMTSSPEPSGTSWVPLTQMRQNDNYGFAAAVLGTSDIIVTSGQKPRVREVWLYNVELDNWAKLAPMNVSRYWHKLAVLQGKVYAIGGKNSVSPALRSVEVYDRHLNKWSDGVSLPEPRKRPAVAVLDGNIYVIGGYDEKDVATSTVYRFSPGDTEWHPQSDMPVAWGPITASVFNGHIYVAGHTPSWIYCFTPDDNGGSWSEVKTKEIFLPNTKSCGMTVFGGKLYIYGGRNGHNVKNNVYCLDPEAKSVKFVGNMSKGLLGHACVTVLKGDREYR
ncbi:kelch-like protein 24 [Branchiostoma floridae x Branchiostoma belcheri]